MSRNVNCYKPFLLRSVPKSRFDRQCVIWRGLGCIIPQFDVMVIVKIKGLDDIQAKFFGVGFYGPRVNLVDKSYEDGESLDHL